MCVCELGSCCCRQLQNNELKDIEPGALAKLPNLELLYVLTVFVYCVYTVCTLCVHCVYTVCILYLGGLLTIKSVT